MNKIYLLSVSMMLLLQGCATHSSLSKTLILTPEKGQSTVVVESVAKSKCTDIVGNINCELSIDLHQAHREGAATNVAPIPPVTATHSSSTNSNGNAVARLKALEELKDNNLITYDEYRMKRQQIMNAGSNMKCNA